MKAKLITLSGKVQGVGFRYHTKSLADRYDIKGYAKNLKEDVEILALGEESALDQFIGQVVDGPSPGSRVENHTVESVESDEKHNDFKTL